MLTIAICIDLVGLWVMYQSKPLSKKPQPEMSKAIAVHIKLDQPTPGKTIIRQRTKCL